VSKDAVTDWDTDEALNLDVGGIGIGEGCAMANLNDAIREMMAQIAASDIAAAPLETWAVALSDETTAITTGANKATLVIPYAFTVVGVAASLNTASSSGTPTFDIHEGVTTILSTKIVIDEGELTGGSTGYQGTASGAAVISDTSIAAFSQICFDIDVAGTGAKGAKVYIIGRRT
jgi:hypothetical protein